MRVEIGKGLVTYGTVESTPHGLTVRPSAPDYRDRLHNIVRNMRQPDQSDEEFLATLPRQLDGRMWARPLTH